MTWESEAHTYNTLHPRLVLVRDSVVEMAPSRVLELGCSVGKLREALLKEGGVDYWGCDLSKSAVALINDPQVVSCDLNEDPLPFEESFDCVVASGVLEYINDIPSLLANARERIPIGGHLVVTYTNMTHVLRRIAKAVGRTQLGHPDWRTSFSPSEVTKIIEEAGFQVVREVTVSLLLRRQHPPRNVPWLGRMLGGEVLYVARAVM